MGRFNKGVFIGSILGASAVWMNTTKQGKEVKEKLKDHAQEAFDELKEKLSESDLMDKVKYDARVKKVVEEFTKRKALPAKAGKILEGILKSQWKRIQTAKKKK